jgi:chromosome segregation ATPase
LKVKLRFFSIDQFQKELEKRLKELDILQEGKENLERELNEEREKRENLEEESNNNCKRHDQEIQKLNRRIEEVEIERDNRPPITFDQWEDYNHFPNRQELNEIQQKSNNPIISLAGYLLSKERITNLLELWII